MTLTAGGVKLMIGDMVGGDSTGAREYFSSLVGEFNIPVPQWAIVHDFECHF